MTAAGPRHWASRGRTEPGALRPAAGLTLKMGGTRHAIGCHIQKDHLRLNEKDHNTRGTFLPSTKVPSFSRLSKQYLLISSKPLT